MDGSTHETPGTHDVAGMDRRQLLLRMAGLSVLTATGSFGSISCTRAERLRPTPPAVRGGPGGRALVGPDWWTLYAAQDVLLPSDPGAPGARDANATGYVDALLLDPDVDPDDKQTLRDGLAWLQASARARGDRPFDALDEAARDAILVEYRRTDGGAYWLWLVIGWTIEALLGDPIHGGNPRGVGWSWIGYQPGQPRPKGAPEIEGS